MQTEIQSCRKAAPNSAYKEYGSSVMRVIQTVLR